MLSTFSSDPHNQDSYEEYSAFLHPLNHPSRDYCEADSEQEHNKFLCLQENPEESYKANFEQIQDLVLIGGPDDGVITPWQSRCVWI